MKILKNEYKITKDNDFEGKRFNTYTIEKIITYTNGETESRFRNFIPEFEGDINTVDLDKLEFPKAITCEEWNKLSPEYRKAWYSGNLTEKLQKELEILRMKGCIN